MPVGSLFNQLMYAVKFSEPNFLLSGRVNENSSVLYNRNPRQRVEKVAPWLTIDGDPYPVVVDGKIEWVLDGYTTTDRYPLGAARVVRDDDRRLAADHDHRAAHAADRRGQLHAQRGQGDRGRLRRHGHALRVGRERPDPRRLAQRLPGHGQGQVADPGLAAGPPALPRGPVQGAALPVRALPRDGRRRLVPGQQPLAGAGRPEQQGQGRAAAAVPAVRQPAEGSGGSRPEHVLADVGVHPERQEQPRGLRVGGLRRHGPGRYGRMQVLELPDQRTAGSRADRQRVRRPTRRCARSSSPSSW